MHFYNVYAPCSNKDTKDFFDKLKGILNDDESELKILCGDFNTVLCNGSDIISGNVHNASLVEAFNELLNECELSDVWRVFNRDKKEYTWSRKTENSFVARRLDYILVNDNALDVTYDTSLLSVPTSDHRGVTVTIKSKDCKRGPSYYKFNNGLLKDKAFVEYMNNQIDEFLATDNEENPVDKWELLKIKIKENAIQYSKTKAVYKRNRIASLYSELNDYDTSLAKDPHDVVTQNKRECLKLKIEIEEQDILRGAQVRSKEKWIEEGEKNTKFFLNLEKNRASSRLFHSIELDNGERVTSQFDILNEQKRYHKEIYSKELELETENIDDRLGNFLNECQYPTLSQEEMQSCEGLITLKEASVALKMLNNGTSPGIDGLSTEFLKFFWGKLNKTIVDSFNFSFSKGSLSYTQKLAIITLLHKGKELPRHKLKNWRPISLTNSDYKILAKCLANRLCKVIEKVVSEDQVGYVKGRNVSSTLRTIDDIIDFWRLRDKPGILLALDFQKAFDSISKKYMLSVFRRFGFGRDFTNWVSVLFSETESCIIYNGWLSETFDVKCGIRQGCPFSPLAFIIGVEALAIRIRNSPNIKGLCIDVEKIIKILLYADDITVFLEDEQDVRGVLESINIFSIFSGLKLNMNKSEVMPIGKKKTIELSNGLRTVNEIKILGIVFSNTKNASCNENNWKPKIDKIKQTIKQWEKRNLGYLGKICVIKTFLISQLIYVMKALCLPEIVLKEINTLLYRFL